MSAPNFYLRNAKRYFVATEPSEEDENYSHFWFDELQDYLAETAEELGFEAITNKAFVKEYQQHHVNAYGMRDYCGSIVPACFECDENDWYDGYWRVRLIPVVRSGYYSGAVLDFCIELRTEYGEDLYNEDVFSGDVLDDEINCYFEWLRENEGKVIEESEYYKLKDLIEGLIERATAKFYEFCEASGLDEYVKAWQCSNGEAGYTNLSEIKRRAGKKKGE